ncbi:hypothetical protein EDB80DRAFT_722210 [Ilyonectria destructans]|nr:hypothetical protein EDB80DRAFT_722210 [Ilyonectria destructans]
MGLASPITEVLVLLVPSQPGHAVPPLWHPVPIFRPTLRTVSFTGIHSTTSITQFSCPPSPRANSLTLAAPSELSYA